MPKKFHPEAPHDLPMGVVAPEAGFTNITTITAEVVGDGSGLSIGQMLTVSNAAISLKITDVQRVEVPPDPLPAGLKVTMTGDEATGRFTPQELTVPVGATVEFVNASSRSFWVRGDFWLKDQPQGTTQTFTFRQPGRFQFYDQYHGGIGQHGPLNGTIIVEGNVPLPIPGPLPTLATATTAPAQIKSGGASTVTATLTSAAPAGKSVTLQLAYSSGVSGPSTLVVVAGQLSVSAPVQAAAGFTGTATVTVTDGTVTRIASLSVVGDTVPTPTPSGKLNVRDYGAVGDGKANDTAAIQKAINAAASGKTIYAPTGTYLLGSGLSVMMSGLSFEGDGDQSILKHGLGPGMHVGGAGAHVQDFSVQKLQFIGAPGLFAGQGNNAAHTIQCDGTRNISVRDVLFTGCAHCVYEVNQAIGILVENCRVVGWGRVAFGLGDGSIIRNNVLTQNDPDPQQKSVTYAFYPHNSCKNVLIEGNKVANVGSYPVHYWAQADVGPGGPVTIRDNQFLDCDLGMFIGSGDGNVGRIRGLTVQRNVWRGKPHGSYVNLTNADDVLFEDNTIDSGVDPQMALDKVGLAIGMWAPTTTNGLITNGVFRNNRVSGFDIGLYALASNGGRFAGCSIGPNQITNCRRPQIAEPSVGLVVVP